MAEMKQAKTMNSEEISTGMAAKSSEPQAEYGSLEVVNIRLVKEPSLISSTPIKSDLDAVKVITEHMAGFDREVFGVLNLSSRGTPISFNVVSIGTLTESLVSPREIFKAAILQNASAVLGFHCHPSGCPEPSQTDIVSTRRMQQAGELLNIKVIDHIIVGCGTGESMSFAARGMMSPDINLEAVVNEPDVLKKLNEGWKSAKGRPQQKQQKQEPLKLKRKDGYER